MALSKQVPNKSTSLFIYSYLTFMLDTTLCQAFFKGFAWLTSFDPLTKRLKRD